MTMLLEMPCWGVKIYPSEGHPWNGFTKREDEDVESFETGVYFKAFEHMMGCGRCRHTNLLTLFKVRRELGRLKGEWRRQMF
jgi:hypothetical protein